MWLEAFTIACVTLKVFLDHISGTTSQPLLAPIQHCRPTPANNTPPVTHTTTTTITATVIRTIPHISRENLPSSFTLPQAPDSCETCKAELLTVKAELLTHKKIFVSLVLILFLYLILHQLYTLFQELRTPRRASPKNSNTIANRPDIHIRPTKPTATAPPGGDDTGIGLGISEPSIPAELDPLLDLGINPANKPLRSPWSP